jgi:hypothetical protein
MYKVLWIDDQYNDPEMIQFAIEADNEGLILEGYESFEEGSEALERNLDHFDLILLDGLFFEKKDQEAGTEDESGIGMAIAKINELKSRKVFPWFVLSGKDSFTKGENSILKANKAKCFDKTNPTDVVRLLEEMKLAASQQPDTQLKFKHSTILSICQNHLIGEENFSRLFELIKDIEKSDKIKGGEDKLTTIRKVVEALFTTLGKYEIISSEIVGQKGWINGSSLFLSGRHYDYPLQNEIIPPFVSNNIYKLLEIIQDGSHAYGELKYKVDSYMKEAQSDYFFRSCVYLLFDILHWFKEFIENNPNINTNREKWEVEPVNKKWISGRIIRIEKNGWGTFKPDSSSKDMGIPPAMMKDKGVKVSDNIFVITEPSPDGDKTFIKEISKEI